MPGCVADTWPPSAFSTRSTPANKPCVWLVRKSGRFGDPISSCPSRRNLQSAPVVWETKGGKTNLTQLGFYQVTEGQLLTYQDPRLLQCSTCYLLTSSAPPASWDKQPATLLRLT